VIGADVAAAGRLVVAAALAAAATTKLLDRRVVALRTVALLGPVGRPVAAVLPVVELVLAVALLSWWSPVPGFVALVLLVVFTAALGRAAHVRVPCPCFGGAASTPPGPRDVVRNALLAVAALAALGSPAGADVLGTGLLVLVWGGAVVGSARPVRRAVG